MSKLMSALECVFWFFWLCCCPGIWKSYSRYSQSIRINVKWLTW